MTILKTIALAATVALPAFISAPAFAQSETTNTPTAQTQAEGPITIVVYFATKPGMEQQAKDVVNSLIHDVTKEDGNLNVSMFQDPENPQNFLFVESFVSRAAEKAHTQTPHMAAFYKATEEFLAEPATVKYWTPFGMMDGKGRPDVTFAN